MSNEMKATNPKDGIGATKVPLHLLSPVASAYWAGAQFCGDMKYQAWNWRPAGARASVYLAAAKRHLDRWNNGERLDPKDMTHHLGNVMACCAILLEAEAIGNLVDDRPPSFSLDKVYEEVEGQVLYLTKKYSDIPRAPHTINNTFLRTSPKAEGAGQ